MSSNSMPWCLTARIVSLRSESKNSQILVFRHANNSVTGNSNLDRDLDRNLKRRNLRSRAI